MRRIVIVSLLFGLVAPGAAASPLSENQRVKVKGEISAQRILAHSVHRKDDADRDFELVGRVAAFRDDGSIQVHGVWVEADHDELNRRARQLWRRLEVGSWVKVEGAWGPGGVLVADSFERPRKKRRVESVEGLLSMRMGGAGSWRLGPFVVESSAATEWKGFE